FSYAARQAGSSVIQAGTSPTISFTTFVPDAVPTSVRAKQYSDDQVEALLAGKSLTDVPMTLEIDVNESDDPGGSLWLFVALQQIDPGCRLYDFAQPRLFHMRSYHFAADRISAFIDGSI